MLHLSMLRLGSFIQCNGFSRFHISNTRSGTHVIKQDYFLYIVFSCKVKTNSVISSHWWETADHPRQHPGQSSIVFQWTMRIRLWTKNFFILDSLVLAYFVIHVESGPQQRSQSKQSLLALRKQKQALVWVCIIVRYKCVSGQVSGTFMVIINQKFLS